MKIFNAGPGFSQPMTEDEISSFLTSGKRISILELETRKIEPNIHHIWYYCDPSKEKFYIGTSKYSKKKRST